MKEVTDGATTQRYGFDALGRQTAYDDGVAPVSFTYDSLDRIAQRSQGITASSFTYSGFDIDPAQDGTFTYGRSPGGRLLSMKKGGDSFLAGMNRHGDLTYLFGTDATLTDTRVYDPFGKLMEKTGLTDPNLGFQSDFTDPTSDKVWMGSRWYGPNEAQFLSRDTVFGQLQTPISLNRYTYAFGDPLDYFDPDGRWSYPLMKRGWSELRNLAFGTLRNWRQGYRFIQKDPGKAVGELKTAGGEAIRTLKIQSLRKQFRVWRPKAKEQVEPRGQQTAIATQAPRVAEVLKTPEGFQGVLQEINKPILVGPDWNINVAPGGFRLKEINEPVDSRIEKLFKSSGEKQVSDRKGGGGEGKKTQTEPTKTDRLKAHLTKAHLEAAQRELRGEVVSRRPDGAPYDHVKEVRDAQRGLLNRISFLERQLANPKTGLIKGIQYRAELGAASRRFLCL